MPEISVVIPAYNEESRLPATLSSVHEFLTSTERSFEIIVVDDGSCDHTIAAVESFGQHHDYVRLFSYSPNQGKGYAVRAGIMAAEGDLILLNDADGSSPIEEFLRLETAIADGADIAIGSRAKMDDTRIVNALPYRKYIGNVFNIIVQSLLLNGLEDTQCGFKLFKRQVAKEIFPLSLISGYGYDVEVLYIAKLHGYKISEVAIDWNNVSGSKVNVFVDSPKMLWEVFHIFLSSITGQYSKSKQA